MEPDDEDTARLRRRLIELRDRIIEVRARCSTLGIEADDLLNDLEDRVDGRWDEK